jgi:hypothetical protein
MLETLQSLGLLLYTCAIPPPTQTPSRETDCSGQSAANLLFIQFGHCIIIIPDM